MPKAFLTPKQLTFFRAVGADLRALRVAAGMTQEEMGDILNWNKDAISKIERGINSLSLYDYLELMIFMRDMAPNHPALTLARHFADRTI